MNKSEKRRSICTFRTPTSVPNVQFPSNDVQIKDLETIISQTRMTMLIELCLLLLLCDVILPCHSLMPSMVARVVSRSRLRGSPSEVSGTAWQDLRDLLDISNSTQTLLNLVQYGQTWRIHRSIPIELQTVGGFENKASFSRVPGCMSNVLLQVKVHDLSTGNVEIHGDADSKLALGILAVITTAIERYGVHLSTFMSLNLQEVLEGSPSDSLNKSKEDHETLATFYKMLPRGRMNGFLNILKLIQQQLLIQASQRSQKVEEVVLHSNEADFNNDHQARQDEIAVLLSGGVDSSVTLALLNHIFPNKVRAYYLKIWLEDELAHLNECPWEEDIAYAQATCEALDVPLHVLSLQKEYREHVVEYTLQEARAGRTPNPDIMCNSRIKFGMFYEYIGKYHKCIATGHYAQSQLIHNDQQISESGVVGDEMRMVQDELQDGIKKLLSDWAMDVNQDEHMHVMNIPTNALQDKWKYPLDQLSHMTILGTSPDAIKDQSYFLSNLRQYQLAKCLFPIGQFQKSMVRKLADKFNLPTKNRKDSQGICFLGKLKFDDFLKYYLGESEGEIRHYLTHEVMGQHRGLWYHTIGQRKGLGPHLDPGYVHLGPWFVAAKDRERNILYVTNDLSIVNAPRLNFEVVNMNWFVGMPPALLQPTEPVEVMMKLRHGPTLVPAKITVLPTKNDEDAFGSHLQVQLLKKDKGIAPGQFAALYEGDVCLGAGMIAETLLDESHVAIDQT